MRVRAGSASPAQVRMNAVPAKPAGVRSGAVRRIGWGAELSSGAVGAFVTFSIAVPVGAVALAPLGPSFAGLAVAAALVSAIVGGLVAALAGNNPVLRTAPMTAVALVMSSVLASMLAVPELRATGRFAYPYALGMALASMALGGLFQLALSTVRIGSIINFVPRPVLAGFRNGVALLIVVSQLPVLVGLASPVWSYDHVGLLNLWQPWNLVVTGAGVAAIVVLRALGVTAIAPLVGMLTATLVHYGLRSGSGIDALGPVIGALPLTLAQLPTVAMWLPQLVALRFESWPILPVLSGALSAALVGSVLTLLVAKAMEDSPFIRSDSDRALRAQGSGNVASAMLGGVPAAGSLALSLAIHGAGGRSRNATFVAIGLLALGVFACSDWIAKVPLAALASVMLMFGWDTFDRDSMSLLRNAFKVRPGRGKLAQDLLIVVVVAAASLVFDVVIAVLTGMAIAAVQFVVSSSVPVVRRRSTGAVRRSLLKRSEFESQRLERAGAQIVIFELQGPLFFGTAEHLADEVLRHAEGARYVILDLVRVNAIDATGAHLMRQLRDYLRTQGGDLLLSGIPANDARRDSLISYNDDESIRWFHDADRALEWCETRLLSEQTVDTTFARELPFARMDLCHGMAAADIAQLQSIAMRSAHPAGSLLFGEGTMGETIYLLAYGRVSMLLDRGPGRTPRRVATFTPGVVFGELAVLESRVRTTSVQCDVDIVVWSISSASLDALTARNPALAAAVYRALSRNLAGRLRETTRELRDLSDP